MSSDASAPGHGEGAEHYCPSCDRSYGVDVKRCPSDGTVLVRMGSSDPLIGREFGGYTLKERLGEGGMGAVYRGWQHSVGREVAIKVIRSNVSTDRVTAKRFLREAKLASRLAQPSTVGVLDFGQSDDGILYLAMELLRGKTLLEVLRRDGAMPAERVVRIGVQLCDALDAAHRLSIIHRDLKPSNVIVLDDPPGRDAIKVLDFGLAKSLVGDDSTATHSDHIVGTPAYTSPEVAQGQPADARSDLYSLGVMLYELTSGKRPFLAETVPDMLAKHVGAAPRPLPGTVPPVLGNLIMRLLEKEPARRYPSAAQVREALLATGERTPRASAETSTPTPVDSALAHEHTEEARAVEATPAASSEPSLTRTSAPSPPRALASAGDAPSSAPPRRRTGVWLYAVALIVVAGGGLAIWKLRQPDAPGAAAPSPSASSPGGASPVASASPATSASPTASAPPSASASPTASASPSASPAPSPSAGAGQVRLHFESSPSATVRLDDQVLGETPLDHDISPSKRATEVRFTRDGYRTERRRITPDRAQTVRASLDKDRRTTPSTSPSPSVSASPTPPPSVTAKPSPTPSPSKFLPPD